METVEAVIISGPRKGEIVLMRDEQFAPRNGDGNGETEPQLSPEEEKVLAMTVEAAQHMAKNAFLAVEEMRALRVAVDKLHEAAVSAPNEEDANGLR